MEKAIEYFEKTLDIVLKLSDEGNPKVSICYNNLGLALVDKGNTSKAVVYFEKAYTTFSKLYGDDNPTTKIAKQNFEGCLNKITDIKTK